MRYPTEDKRKLLTDLLAGKVDALRTYQRHKTDTTLKRKWPGWIIDARAVGGEISTTDEHGKQVTMSETDFKQLPRHAPVWQIVDMTGGKTPPPVDE